MNANQLSSYIAVLAPRVLTLVTERKKVSELEAIRLFYNSEVYATLEKEETKLWRLSAETLYTLLDEELTTGSITYPEEQ